MKESQIEKKIREYAESKGCLYEKFTSPGKRGVADRLVTTPHGVTGRLEVKKPGGDIHPKQIRLAVELINMKVPVGIVDTVEDGIKFIDYLRAFSLVCFAEEKFHNEILDS